MPNGRSAALPNGGFHYCWPDKTASSRRVAELVSARARQCQATVLEIGPTVSFVMVGGRPLNMGRDKLGNPTNPKRLPVIVSEALRADAVGAGEGI